MVIDFCCKLVCDALYEGHGTKKENALYFMQASFALKLHISLRKSLPMFSAGNGKSNDIFVIIKANRKGKDLIAVLNKMDVVLSEHHLCSLPTVCTQVRLGGCFCIIHRRQKWFPF